MKTELKDTIRNVKNKETNDKYNYKYISFSFRVAPYVTVINKIVEYYNGSVECYSNFSFRKNYTKKRPAKKKYGTKKHDTKHIYPDADKKRPKLDTTCKIIKNHHSDMKDDPERLTTDFILELINTKRNGENKK